MSITVNQQFEGPTIEEALESAVSTLGDDLQILDAQRVKRRGLLRLRKQERFEVTASKKSTAEPKDFGDVLQRMVDRVDEAERSLGSDLSDTDAQWWSDADFVVPKPDPVADAPLRSELPAEAELPAVTPSEPPATHDDDPAWTGQALLDLGLPPALVARIDTNALSRDLDWVSALAGAIGDLLETARLISGPCELTGHGAESAVHLIQGACDGFRLDSLIIEGRRVSATPLELSLAIRTLLARPQSRNKA